VQTIDYSRTHLHTIHHPQLFPRHPSNTLSTPHPNPEAEAAIYTKLQSSLLDHHKQYRTFHIPQTHRIAIAHIVIPYSTWGTKISFGPQHASKQVAKCRSSSDEQYVHSLCAYNIVTQTVSASHCPDQRTILVIFGVELSFVSLRCDRTGVGTVGRLCQQSRSTSIWIITDMEFLSQQISFP